MLKRQSSSAFLQLTFSVANLLNMVQNKLLLLHSPMCSVMSPVWLNTLTLKKKKDFIYFFIFRKKGRERERGRDIVVWLPLTRPLLVTWPTTQACALTGNQSPGPLVHRPALNP